MNLKNDLKNLDVDVEENKDLSLFSTMRLKAKGTLITVRSSNALEEMLKIFSSKKQNYQILGMGANSLLSENSEVPYISLKFKFDKESLVDDGKDFILPASLRLSTLTSFAVKNNLKGWEVFTGVPASLGGAVVMNAGTSLGEIGDLVKRVWIVQKSGETKTIDIDENSFTYRKNNFLNDGDVIYQVGIKNLGKDEKVSEVIRNYLKKRNDSQPMKEWTCGCVFKNSSFNENPCPAGKYIDIIGLKGLSIGDMRISDVHGNFFENTGSSTREDVLELIMLAKEELYLQFGVNFELEARIEE